jgi:hypothetical protein
MRLTNISFPHETPFVIMINLTFNVVFYSHKNITTLYFQKFELLSGACNNCAY